MRDRDSENSPLKTYQQVGLLAGPLLFLIFLLTDQPVAMSRESWITAGVVLWIATWWATEPVPIPVTSLLPLLIFPLVQIGDVVSVAKNYASPVVYLLLGGFVLALGLQKWQLHRRLALKILMGVGSSPIAIVAGFMLATAALSMWVSNTATTLMIIPIALSIAAIVAPEQENSADQHRFVLCLMLGVAYAASIGGIGTLVGTPPNILMAGYLNEAHGIELDFFSWLLFGLPVMLVMLPVSWLILTRVVYKFELPRNVEAEKEIRLAHKALGKMESGERRMLAVFLLVVAFWVFRPFLADFFGLPGLSDTAIALTGAVALFIIPSGKGGSLIDWLQAKQMPWDVLLLYGGGMALAAAITGSGLADWIGIQLEHFSQVHVLLLMLLVTCIVIFVTELTNNSATIATLLPILAALSAVADVHPLQLAAPAVVAASCAFMLPVATPPNAIVYGTGQVSLPEMAKGGIAINLVGICVIPVISYFTIDFLISRF